MHVVVRSFPHDERIAADVRRIALALSASVDSEAALRDRVERALRASYPRLVIRVRDELAGFDSHERVWYVIRDGRIHKPNRTLDRLYEAMGEARSTYDASVDLVGRAKASMEQASAPRRRPTSARSRDTGSG
jgi:hypothetical protein